MIGKLIIYKFFETFTTTFNFVESAVRIRQKSWEPCFWESTDTFILVSNSKIYSLKNLSAVTAIIWILPY